MEVTALESQARGGYLLNPSEGKECEFFVLKVEVQRRNLLVHPRYLKKR